MLRVKCCAVGVKRSSLARVWRGGKATCIAWALAVTPGGYTGLCGWCSLWSRLQSVDKCGEAEATLNVYQNLDTLITRSFECVQSLPVVVQLGRTEEHTLDRGLRLIGYNARIPLRGAPPVCQERAAQAGNVPAPRNATQLVVVLASRSQRAVNEQMLHGVSRRLQNTRCSRPGPSDRSRSRTKDEIEPPDGRWRLAPGIRQSSVPDS